MVLKLFSWALSTVTGCPVSPYGLPLQLPCVLSPFRTIHRHFLYRSCQLFAAIHGCGRGTGAGAAAGATATEISIPPELSAGASAGTCEHAPCEAKAQLTDLRKEGCLTLYIVSEILPV